MGGQIGGNSWVYPEYLVVKTSTGTLKYIISMTGNGLAVIGYKNCVREMEGLNMVPRGGYTQWVSGIDSVGVSMVNS